MGLSPTICLPSDVDAPPRCANNPAAIMPNQLQLPVKERDVAPLFSAQARGGAPRLHSFTHSDFTRSGRDERRESQV
jgi:hypothetical protein